MSRVGNAPIAISSEVKVNIADDNTVSVSGKLGELSYKCSQDVNLELKDGSLTIAPKREDSKLNAVWGLTRSLLNNMVIGVSKGFEKKLEIIGVGYKADVAGHYLNLYLGYSHDIKFEIPKGVTIKALKPTLLSITGCDKHLVGQVAALIVKQRPPEPYKGKGIKYEGKAILRKEGKKK